MRGSAPLSAVIALFSAAVFGSTLVSVPTIRCTSGETVASTTYIGEDSNVKLTLSHCNDEPLLDSDGNFVPVGSLAKRQSNDVCGATCDTYCWSATSSAANASDCTVIADALLYESQNTGVLFNVTAFGTTTNKVTMEYGTCLTYFLNQDFSTLTYCRIEWSNLVASLSSDCSAANGANGGLCVASDQRWYIQQQHS